mmetsp:Transcript_26050/g.72841  ORF Transcript_26050/g.72841 Transcript_26050/m.72841 type:complete len:231 (-) Transcript_26050:221-913(-)
MAPIPSEAGVEWFRARIAALAEFRSNASLSADSAAQVVGVLDELAAAPVTLHELRESGAGLEVNSKFLRKHALEVVRTRAAALVARWKQLVVSGGGTQTLAEVACATPVVPLESRHGASAVRPLSSGTSMAANSSAFVSPCEHLHRMRCVDGNSRFKTGQASVSQSALPNPRSNSVVSAALPSTTAGSGVPGADEHLQTRRAAARCGSGSAKWRRRDFHGSELVGSCFPS